MDLKSSFKPFPGKFFRIYYSTHVSLPCIQFFLREKPQIDIKKIKIFIDFTFDHFSYSISNVFFFFAEPASGVFRACRSSKCSTRAVRNISPPLAAPRGTRHRLRPTRQINDSSLQSSEPEFKVLFVI